MSTTSVTMATVRGSMQTSSSVTTCGWPEHILWSSSCERQGRCEQDQDLGCGAKCCADSVSSGDPRTALVNTLFIERGRSVTEAARASSSEDPWAGFMLCGQQCSCSDADLAACSRTITGTDAATMRAGGVATWSVRLSASRGILGRGTSRTWTS